MPNLSFTGFHPYGNNGSTSTQTKRFRVASNNGTAIFKGDCIVYSAAGVAGLATANGGVSSVAQGAEFWDATINGRRSNPFLPAATTYTGTTFDDHADNDQSFLYMVADPVNTRFQCQYATGVPALTDMTKNSDFIAGAGSTVNGISGHTLSQVAINTTLTLDFRILDWIRKVSNDMTAVSAKVIVQINNGRVPPFGTAAPGSIGI